MYYRQRKITFKGGLTVSENQPKGTLFAPLLLIFACSLRCNREPIYNIPIAWMDKVCIICPKCAVVYNAAIHTKQ